MAILEKMFGKGKSKSACMDRVDRVKIAAIGENFVMVLSLLSIWLVVSLMMLSSLPYFWSVQRSGVNANAAGLSYIVPMLAVMTAFVLTALLLSRMSRQPVAWLAWLVIMTAMPWQATSFGQKRWLSRWTMSVVLLVAIGLIEADGWAYWQQHWHQGMAAWLMVVSGCYSALISFTHHRHEQFKQRKLSMRWSRPALQWLEMQAQAGLDVLVVLLLMMTVYSMGYYAGQFYHLGGLGGGLMLVLLAQVAQLVHARFWRRCRPAQMWGKVLMVLLTIMALYVICAGRKYAGS